MYSTNRMRVKYNSIGIARTIAESIMNEHGVPAIIDMRIAEPEEKSEGYAIMSFHGDGRPSSGMFGSDPRLAKISASKSGIAEAVSKLSECLMEGESVILIVSDYNNLINAKHPYAYSVIAYNGESETIDLISESINKAKELSGNTSYTADMITMS